MTKADKHPIRRVMVVDDDPTVRRVLVKALESWGAEATAVSNGPAAVRAAEARQFDIAITDIKMPGMDGHELLRQLKVLDPEMDVVMITAYGTIESAVQAMRDGAAEYITKPFSIEEVRLKLERIRRTRLIRKENRALRSQLCDGRGVYRGARLIGGSPSMRAVYQKIRAVAAGQCNVLVQGETGTGKELVAKAIHYSGPRAGNPFIALECGSVSKTLLDSRLFGHVKGAFTDAIKDNPGFFVAADGGTLFLDEITEVDAETQMKLLRALQEREVTPVGGTKPVPFDVRVIAATNGCIHRAVEEGRLSQDLYFRLSEAVIEPPPLRERKEDIPTLVDYLNARLSGEYGLAPRKVSEEAMEILLAHDWPGNVRELENVIEHAFALGEGPVILPEHLPPEIVTGQPGKSEAQPEVSALRDTEKETVRCALVSSGWNKSEAARKLGIDRKRLYRMIRKHKLVKPGAGTNGGKR